MELRPYQAASVQAVLSEWNENDKTLLVLPTGGGKTICFSKIIEHLLIKPENRVLVLAHRAELLTQAQDKLLMATGISSAIEKAEQTTLGTDERVVIGSVQSMAGSRLSSFPENYFTHIIVDEAHHCVSDTYQRVFERFPNAKILGVTATPSRSDKKDLSKFFDSTAFEYTMLDGINDGYLSPITVQRIPLKLDISRVATHAGDYAVGELGDTLDPYLDAIIDNLAIYCKGRKTILFTPLVKTSKKLVAKMLDRGLRAVEVNGNSADRAEATKAFEEGEYDFLVNAMLMTEGYDCPAVDCIVVLRPTRSKGLFQQMIGRGTRLSPETGKKNLLLLDFLWISKKTLCRPSSLIAETEDMERYMNDISLETDECLSLEELQRRAKRKMDRDLEESMRKKLAECQKEKRQFLSTLQFFASIGELGDLSYEPVFRWESEPPTEKQLETIAKFGLDPNQITTKGFARKILGICVNRAKQGLSTIKQIKLLERYGFQRVGEWTCKEANQVIDKIASNHWRIPYGMPLVRPGFQPKKKNKHRRK